ncbi:adenosylmethionine decarboxylase [Tropicimonas sp.]|uniref:adenosylmethionine decarboxylase n=1 Tax=Tropicimonas sp. TaxID=2067044 RepID=UPI003A89F3A6
MLPAQHVLLELHGSDHLADAGRIEAVLKGAAQAAGARVLGAHFHRFAGGGVTGVLLLAESHISIHTWPENDYAAVDVFMCGAANAALAAATVAEGLAASASSAMTVERGISRTTPPSPAGNSGPAGGCGSS